MYLYATIVLIVLHAPDGREVDVNPDEITSLQGKTATDDDDRDKKHRVFAPGANCVINLSDGKFAAVQEECETVREMIKRGNGN